MRVGSCRTHLAQTSNGGITALVHPDAGPFNPPVYKDGYADNLDSIDKDGCVSVPEGPGLGVTYDWDFIIKNRTAYVGYK